MKRPTCRRRRSTVLEKHGSAGDAGLRKQVAAAVSGVAASLRKRLEAWLGSGGEADQPAKSEKPRSAASAGSLADLEKQAAALPARWVKLAGIPDLAGGCEGRPRSRSPRSASARSMCRGSTRRRNLQPVADLDEWIDVCAHFLESPEEIDEGERVLEGLSRLCDQSPDELAVQLGPLKKRIDKIYRGPVRAVSGQEPARRRVRRRAGLDRRPGGDGEEVEEPARTHDVAISPTRTSRLWGVNDDTPALVALAQRSRELAERAAQRAGPAAARRGDPPGRLARSAGVCRAAVGSGTSWASSRRTTMRSWRCCGWLPTIVRRPSSGSAKLKGELADAARYALGGEKPAFGKTAALWVAAARARDPLADDPLVEKRFPNLGPDAGTAARYEWSYRPESHTFSGKTYHYVLYRLQVAPRRRRSRPRTICPRCS